MTKRCLWCGLPLRFTYKTGWIHPDGTVVVVRDGRDHHVATPDHGPPRSCTCETTGDCFVCRIVRYA